MLQSFAGVISAEFPGERAKKKQVFAEYKTEMLKYSQLPPNLQQNIFNKWKMKNPQITINFKKLRKKILAFLILGTFAII